MQVLSQQLINFSHVNLNGTTLELYIPVNKDDKSVVVSDVVKQSDKHYIFNYGDKQQFSIVSGEKPKGKVLYNKYSVELTTLTREELVNLGESLSFPHSLLLQPVAETIFDTKEISANGLRAPVDSSDISYYY